MKYDDQKVSLNLSANKNGMKNRRVEGTATNILFANTKVFPASPFCIFENARTISVDRGKETMNPPRTGFVFDNHSTNESTIDVNATFNAISAKLAPSKSLTSFWRSPRIR